jgi:hypothetical protein
MNRKRNKESSEGEKHVRNHRKQNRMGKWKNERGKNGLKGGNFERFTKKCGKPRGKQMFTN